MATFHDKSQLFQQSCRVKIILISCLCLAKNVKSVFMSLGGDFNRSIRHYKTITSAPDTSCKCKSFFLMFNRGMLQNTDVSLLV